MSFSMQEDDNMMVSSIAKIISSLQYQDSIGSVVRESMNIVLKNEWCRACVENVWTLG